MTVLLCVCVSVGVRARVRVLSVNESSARVGWAQVLKYQLKSTLSMSSRLTVFAYATCASNVSSKNKAKSPWQTDPRRIDSALESRRPQHERCIDYNRTRRVRAAAATPHTHAPS